MTDIERARWWIHLVFFLTVFDGGFVACGGGEVESPSGEFAAEAQATDPVAPDSPSSEGEDPQEPANSAFRWQVSLVGPTDEDEVDGIAADAQGNLYASGKFEGSLETQGDQVQSAGAADIMLARYDRSGELEWIERFGSTGEDNVFDVATDADGNAVLSGMFTGVVEFGEITLRSASLDEPDAVVFKVSPTREVLWAIRAGGVGPDGANEVSVSETGVIAVGMQSQGKGIAVDIGDTEFTNESATSTSYLMLLNTADGSVAWARRVDGTAVRAKCLAIDDRGYVFHGGDFVGTLVAISPGKREEREATGTSDAYLTRWTPGGELEWVKQLESDRGALCKGVAVNATDQIFVTGNFSGSLALDSRTLDSAGGLDQFLLALNNNGRERWVRHISSSDNLSGSELELDLDGGPLFPLRSAATVVVESGENSRIELEAEDAGPALLSFTEDGELANAVATPSGVELGRASEIARSGARVYVDSPVENPGTLKDARVFAYDLAVNGTEERFSVEVRGGHGSGEYRAGELVFVSSDHDPFVAIHAGWEGDTELLAYKNEWHTFFRMPARPVSLRTVHVPVRTVFESFEFIGSEGTVKSVRVMEPDAIVGAMLFLHGTNGSSELVEKLEVQNIAAAAAERGLAFIAIDSEETATQTDIDGDQKLKWINELDPGNIDFRDLNDLILELRARGVVPVNGALYAAGMSAGGGMAVTLGSVAATSVAEDFAELRFDAVVTMCADGLLEAIAATSTPTGWWMCGQQEGSSVKNGEAVAHAASLHDRGIRAHVSVNAPFPLNRDWFRRAPEIDAATSAEIFDALEDQGSLDSSGFVIDPEPSLSLPLSPTVAIRVKSQLAMLGAEHQVYSGQVDSVLDFLSSTGTHASVD
ncbi:MAG: hypothetical protein AAFP04_09965 [Myxococcota bacterium]